MKKLLYAIRFMTIIPIPYRHDEDLDQVAKASIFFPLVGLMLGSLQVGVFLVLAYAGLEILAVVSLTVSSVLLTGGLHLDGLADTADGLGGGKDPESRLRIMKDSRIGAFGALTLLCLLLVKTAAFFELTGHLLAILTAPMAARAIMILTFKLFKTARPGGMGEFFQKRCTLFEPIGGLLYSLTATYLLIGTAGILSFTITLVLALLIAHFFSRRLGGLTGDTYGAITELSELLFIICYAILSGVMV